MNKNINILFEESQLNFSQIYFLCDLFDTLLDSDRKIRKRKLNNLYKKTESEIYKSVRKSGYHTVGDLKLLRERRPKLYALWYKQTSIDLSITLNKVIVELSDFIVPNLLWHSIYAYSYAHFENDIKTICRKLSEIINIDFVLDNSTRILDQIKMFLSLHLKLDFKNDFLWQNIKQYQNIRNIILHNGGNIDSSRRSIQAQSFVNSCNNISIENNKIFISKEFVQESIFIESEFIMAIEDKCYKIE